MNVATQHALTVFATDDAIRLTVAKMLAKAPEALHCPMVSLFLNCAGMEDVFGSMAPRADVFLEHQLGQWPVARNYDVRAALEVLWRRG